ncbi:MAG: hypothetical protein K2J99_04770 [Lachnospiraceae bacterium]|nr:hypothetical protein [Lachnospiraceae bacterium]
MPIDQMKQVLDSMENSIKLRSQAKAEQRAEEASREKHAFQQKLMLAAAGKAELDGMASNVKGKQDAVLRDQLMGFMMAGF